LFRIVFDDDEDHLNVSRTNTVIKRPSSRNASAEHGEHHKKSATDVHNTKFSTFNLSSGHKIDKRLSKMLNHPANSLMEKLNQKKYLKDQMPTTQMFNIITQIHKIAKDFLEKNHPDLPLYCYVYDYIMNKYGIKKIADKKFRQL
jgi:hypothetical protein